MPPPTLEIAGSNGPHFTTFCADLLVHSSDVFAGLPFILEPWEVDFVDDALAYDADGAPFWQSVVLVLPRKNGKTALCAAYALYRLMVDADLPEILLAASSDRQAGRLFDACSLFVRRCPLLAEHLVVREYIGEIARRDGLGRILRMSSSPERLHGYNPSLVVADEVAQWTAPSLRRAWAALTTGGGARQAAQVFTISTAGEAHTRTDGILGRIIDGSQRLGVLDISTPGLTISRHVAARTLVYNYSAPTTEPSDTAAVKLANPASWITPEYLARQAASPELTRADFLQLHANVWTDSDDAWIGAETWRALGRPAIQVEAGERITVGFDGARFADATALIGCRISDGHLFTIGVWEKPRGAAGAGWEVPAPEVDRALAQVMERYDVVRAYFDPPFWQSEVAAWGREYGSAIVEWFTNRPRQMSAAVERLRTDAAAGAVTHDDDPRLTEHVLNARLRPSRSGYWLEKEGRASPAKIDAAVAAVLAWEARADALAAGEQRPRSRRAVFV